VASAVSSVEKLNVRACVVAERMLCNELQLTRFAGATGASCGGAPPPPPPPPQQQQQQQQRWPLQRRRLTCMKRFPVSSCCGQAWLQQAKDRLLVEQVRSRCCRQFPRRL
jgi:hypothetical protein